MNENPNLTPETDEAEMIEENVNNSEESVEESNDAVSEASSDTIPEAASDFQPPKQKRKLIASVYDYTETFCYALALMMVLFMFVFRYVTVDGNSMRETLHNSDKLIISDLFYKPKTGDIIVINPEVHGSDNNPIIKRVIATEGQTVRIDYENWEVYVDGVKLDESYILPMRYYTRNQYITKKIMAEYSEKRQSAEVDLIENKITVDGVELGEEQTIALIEKYKNEFNAQNPNYESTPMHPSDDARYNSEFTVGENMVFVMGDNRNNSSDSRSRKYGEMNENRIIGRVLIRLSPDFGFVK